MYLSDLVECVAYKNEHGSLLDVQGDVKLRLWVFSLIRKLSINSGALKGEKMRLIQAHEGLKDFLLQKEYVEAAVADHKAFLAKEKQKEEAARGGRGVDDDDGPAGAGGGEQPRPGAAALHPRGTGSLRTLRACADDPAGRFGGRRRGHGRRLDDDVLGDAAAEGQLRHGGVGVDDDVLTGDLGVAAGERLAGLGFQSALRGKPQPSIGRCRNGHKSDVLHGRLVAPEVLLTEIAQRQPDSGMHGVVIHRINSLDGRMVTSDLQAIGQASVGKVRTQDLVVTKNEINDRLTVERNTQTITLLLEAKAFA